MFQGQGDGTRLALLDDGGVGIGTTDPRARLHIAAGASERALYLSGGPTISTTSLSTKWNLPPTSGAARLPLITPSSDTAGGFGFIHGDNVTSPVVWMYNYSGRNAFTVARKGYSGMGEDVTDIDAYLTPLLQVRENGNVGIGTTNPQQKLDVNGTTRTKVLQITGGSDLAEPFEVAGEVKPGLVVAIDPDHPGQLRIADRAYDRMVAGCVSGANGIQPGLVMQQEGTAAGGTFPVASRAGSTAGPTPLTGRSTRVTCSRPPARPATSWPSSTMKGRRAPSPARP